MPTLGVYGSGLDTNAIVSALVNAELAPLVERVNRQERDRNAELSSLLGSLSSSLSAIESSLESLESGTTFVRCFVNYFSRIRGHGNAVGNREHREF